MSKIKNWFKLLRDKLELGTKRFPVTIGFSIMAVAMGIYFNHVDSRAYINSIMGGLMIAIPLSGCFAQILSNDKRDRMIQLFGTSVLATGYAFTLSNDTTYFNLFDTTFFQLNIILYASFFIIPYYKIGDRFSEYVFYNVGKFFLTVLYALILFGGLSAVYFTIDVLFELDLMEEVYFDLFLISAGIFGTMHFLGHLPDRGKIDLPYTLLFKRLFLYIVLPLLCVYDIILHAYFVKILLEWSLPQGMIGHLVVWFGLIGVITWFFLNDLGQEYRWLNRLGKIFTIGMVAPLGMLFVAAFIRISDYGITELRYYLVLAGAFEVIAFVYLFIKKQAANVRIAMIGLVFIAVATFGPTSAENMTIVNQNKILKGKIDTYQAYDDLGNIDLDGLETVQKNDINQTASYIANRYEISALYFYDAEFDYDIDTLESRTGLSLDYDYMWKYADPELEYIREFDIDQSQVIPLEGADYLLKYNMGQTLSTTMVNENIQIERLEDESLRFSLGDSVNTVDMIAWFSELAEPDKDHLYRMGTKTIKVGDQSLTLKWVITGLSAEKRQDIITPTYIESYVMITVDN